jgi:hypothetical protein
MNMYLRLFHGRDTVKEDMEENGYPGPYIGPLEFCHTVYGSTLILSFIKGEDKLKFFEAEPFYKGRVWDDTEAWLYVNSECDCIEYQGKYYGDWSCFITEKDRP